ncbi:KxYKxGKxW signal peptide domain-containing protein [Fructilactobacillus ixorae]|uniref:dextransucrase n=1 Tax=Fructilactobacillus ixorae TaxID=1750535 RepID=A0ABY5C6B1_9LACO|nr:glycoside hydrolase family 70 protein [Fructilactobacillus ixorae]USS93373.1 KxYKxGKxW signal peptide domain-containing protein [Fructilactobacillus ixorae]
MKRTNTNLHYKMYKSGKKLVFGAILLSSMSILTTGVLLTSDAHAETTIPKTAGVATAPAQPAEQPTTQSEQNPAQLSTAQPKQAAPEKQTATNSKVQQQAQPDHNPAPTTTIAQNQDPQTPNPGLKPTEQPGTSTKQEPASQPQAPAPVSDQSDHQDVTTDQADHSDQHHDTVTTDHQSQQTETQATTHPDQPAPQPAGPEESPVITLVAQPSSAQPAANATPQFKPTDSHIQLRGNDYYYIDDQGQVVKNLTVYDNGHPFTFDRETGKLVPQTMPEINKLNPIFIPNNAAYSAHAESFTNVNGYLTANTWYRPKEILRDGTPWQASQVTDFRPLLMTWWPNQLVQMNYLSYMQTNNFLGRQFKITPNNQRLLSAYAFQIQKNIERRISANHGDTVWFHDLINDFINSQPSWNIESENQGSDHLQGGALRYENSDLTPYANSDYRLLNRTPSNQTGSSQTGSTGGFEYLLANDVDNSNPVVQAEQLNWLHYMMNIGSIVANDPSANFDGYRVDAVDNVDADLLQIAADYAKAAYHLQADEATANHHLSILEDWENYDADYVKQHDNNQLTMDFPMHLAWKYSLNIPANQRSGLEPNLTTSIVNRTGENKTENQAQPNYSFIRAHDSEVQTVIAQIIKDKINPNSDGLTVTPAEIKQAFEIYDADQKKANKEYTAYNIPASYALMLTNKDTVPRVYYGDLYSDDGQYMATKSPYYEALVALLKNRIKYVAGGQRMNVQYVNSKTGTPTGILTSVRYGKGIETSTQLGPATSRTEGIGVVISNDPHLILDQNARVILEMGLAHRNQAYRALLNTTRTGLGIYQTDDQAPLLYTNDQGQLILTGAQLFSVTDPQVSGYLSVWVPVGAPADQDARTESSTAPVTDGKVFHSNAALDSQLIYEGFSNFQAMPTTEAERTNRLIAQNAGFFKYLGITSFELAPQYRSSTDTSFLDSIVQNGYAFTDRYDVGFDTPTKYGTTDDLLNALRALHQQGLQAINDWVPDQIYNLPGEEIVTASRTDNFGNQIPDASINHTLYDSKTVGGGKYQKEYGGKFLKELQAKYPELFKVKQISTGQPMDPSQRITEWSAKYFNDSNIQHRGAEYVLKDEATNQYFTVTGDSSFLPKQIQGEKSDVGFKQINGQLHYFSTSGYEAKNQFIQAKGNWYYFDADGAMVTGEKTINHQTYFFLPSGAELRDSYLRNQDGTFYFNQRGERVASRFLQIDGNQWRYFLSDGRMATGAQTINGQKMFFNQAGIQVKGDQVLNPDGSINYYEGQNGTKLTNQFAELPDGRWMYMDHNGNAVTGAQTINGHRLYFDQNGIQVKGDRVVNPDGSINYYEGQTGEKLSNQFAELPDGRWMYLNQLGNAVTGEQVIDGHHLYFDQNGIQAKGQTVTNPDGTTSYYDPNSGDLIKPTNSINITK